MTAVARPLLAENGRPHEAHHLDELDAGPVTFDREPRMVMVPTTRVMALDENDPGYDLFRYGSTYYVQRDGYWYRSDKFGLSRQIVPRIIAEMMTDKDPEKSKRVMQALLNMVKPDIVQLKRAYAGS